MGQHERNPAAAGLIHRRSAADAAPLQSHGLQVWACVRRATFPARSHARCLPGAWNPAPLRCAGMAGEEVLFGAFDDSDARGPYQSRVVRTAFVGDSKDKLFFRVYFISLVGRQEWPAGSSGAQHQDNVLKNVARTVPSRGAVGFACCFPNACKIYQFDPSQETRLCGRTFDPRKGFAVRTRSAFFACRLPLTGQPCPGGKSEGQRRNGGGVRSRGAHRCG